MPYKEFNNLIQIIQLIASDCDVQIKSFSDFVQVPDEIAQLLADAVILIDSQAEPNSFESSVIGKIKQLDQHFAVLDKDEYTIQALCTSQEWIKAREAAQAILVMMGLEKAIPDLGWVKFIKG